MFQRVKDLDHPEEDLLSVYREHGVVKRDGRDDNFNKAAQDRRIYQLVHPGWLVVNRMKAWQGSVGVSPFRGIVSGHYICFRPTHNQDHRFLNWLLRSDPYIAEYSSLSRGVRPNQVEIDNEMLRSLQVKLPPLEEQRRIADFLDAETARLDRMASLLRKQVALMELRFTAVVDRALDRAMEQIVPLKYVSTVVDTEHKTAPQVPHGGYWIAGTSSVRNGILVRDALYETDAESYKEWTSRGRPIPGDVLMSREAPVGEVALYRRDDPVIAIGQRMVLVSPAPSRVGSEFLNWSLLCSRTKRFFQLTTQGSLHPHLNMSDIGSIPIAWCALDRQATVARDIAHAVEMNSRILSARTRQLDLLAERRQALITAAVTRQLDVTTSRSGVRV